MYIHILKIVFISFFKKILIDWYFLSLVAYFIPLEYWIFDAVMVLLEESRLAKRALQMNLNYL